jgi:hypothetical protein
VVALEEKNKDSGGNNMCDRVNIQTLIAKMCVCFANAEEGTSSPSLA